MAVVTTETTPEPELLALSNVSAAYGSFQALFGVSLSVNLGEAVAVIGPNGAGKTTLMRVISGLLPAIAGDVRLIGNSITHLPAYRIVAEGIAHVPENRRLFARLTVEENLRMGAFIPAARKHLAERLRWVYDLFPRLKERRGQAAGADARHKFEHLLHNERRQACRRLVHQQHLRFRHQRAPDRAHLLLAARHGAGRLQAAVLQPGKQMIDVVELLGEAGARGRDEGADTQILLDRQLWKQPAVFRHMRDAMLDDVMRRLAADRLPLEGHAAVA